MRSPAVKNEDPEFRPAPQYAVITVSYDGSEGQEKIVPTIEEAREEVKRRLGVQRLSSKRQFVPEHRGIEGYKEDYPSRATQRPGYVLIDLVRAKSTQTLEVPSGQTSILPAADVAALAAQSALPASSSSRTPRVHPTLGPRQAQASGVHAAPPVTARDMPAVTPGNNLIDAAMQLPAARPTSASNTPTILRTHLRVASAGRVREYVVYNPITAEQVIEDLRDRRLEVEEWKERLTLMAVERTIAGVKYVDSEETWERV